MSRIEQALEKASRIREAEAAKAPIRTGGNIQPVVMDYGSMNPNLVTITDPDSPAAEEYRKLKAMVIKITKRDSARNSLMVTSCGSSEGKSLLSVNLGVSLAQEVSHRALLIDADLRRPSLARYLGIDATVGLAECLRDGADVSSAIIPTKVPKLDLLPAGKSVRNPVELLSSPKMKMILGDLKRSYQDRYIIIDTPPILPFAEAQIVSLLADGVLFVVQEGSVTERELREAIDILQGTRIIGITFNSVSAQSMNRRNRYYQRYYAERERPL
jgi:protein-tyrosine kinase